MALVTSISPAFSLGHRVCQPCDRQFEQLLESPSGPVDGRQRFLTSINPEQQLLNQPAAFGPRLDYLVKYQYSGKNVYSGLKVTPCNVVLTACTR